MQALHSRSHKSLCSLSLSLSRTKTICILINIAQLTSTASCVFYDKPINSFNTNICHLQCTVCRWRSRSMAMIFDPKIQNSILSFEIFLWLSATAIECDFEYFDIYKLIFRHVGSKAEMVWSTGQLLQAHLWKCVNQFLIIHSYINEQASGSILGSKLSRLETS